MKRLSLYWICQFIGWGLAALYWSRYQIVLVDNRWMGAVSVLAMLIPGLGATHIYRNMAHRFNWVRLDLLGLVPILLMSLFALSISYFIVGYISTVLIFGPLDLDAYLGMAAGGVRYMAIWLLAFHLYHFGISKKQAEIDQKHYENLAIQAEYNKLNAELNPHFLFNSLNSIKALTIENPDSARNAIDLLSKMLRSSLQISNQKTISISQEITRIQHYIELEKVRFEDRLQFEIKLEGIDENLRIPPLIIYNLVENAVVHSLQRNKHGIKINIDISRNDDKIVIEVSNNGSLDGPIVFGTGLKNIQERLVLIYGDDALLSVLQKDSDTICAKIEFPR